MTRGVTESVSRGRARAAVARVYDVGCVEKIVPLLSAISVV
jgi:hypothetical protein